MQFFCCAARCPRARVHLLVVECRTLLRTERCPSRRVRLKMATRWGSAFTPSRPVAGTAPASCDSGGKRNGCASCDFSQRAACGFCQPRWDSLAPVSNAASVRTTHPTMLSFSPLTVCIYSCVAGISFFRRTTHDGLHGVHMVGILIWDCSSLTTSLTAGTPMRCRSLPAKDASSQFSSTQVQECVLLLTPRSPNWP